MSKFNPKPKQLIHLAINNQEFLNDLPLLNFSNDCLYGVIPVDPLERNDLIDTIWNGRPNTSFKDLDVTPLFMPPDKFVWDTSHQNFNFDLGYSSSMVEIDDDGEETLSLILILNKIHNPVGFLKFTLTHSQFELHEHIIQIHLDQIFIDSNSRNKTNWMDLTVGTLIFLKVMIESMVASSSKYDKLTIYLNAKFASKGGERIGNIILNELNYTIEGLKINYPEKSNCIDEIISQMD